MPVPELSAQGVKRDHGNSKIPFDDIFQFELISRLRNGDTQGYETNQPLNHHQSPLHPQQPQGASLK